MGKYIMRIGADKEAYGGSVYVEAENGTVSIVGSFDGWIGYEILAHFETIEEGESLARRIAADPAAELDALGYDTEGWFTPLEGEK